MAAQGPVIKSFGTYSVSKHGSTQKLTLTSALEPEPFDISPGTQIQVEQVDPDDEPAYLRLIPVEA